MRPFLLSLLLAASAAAQPAEPREPTSPRAAFGLSLGVPIVAVAIGATAAEGSSVGTALLIGGLFVGPSAGNLAQGDWSEALVGTGLRVAGAATVGVAFARAFSDNGGDALSTGLAIAGGAAFVAGTGYDLVTAARPSTRRRVEVAPAGAGLAVRVGL
ncbi:hypothetical protein [Rubrivirga sp. IMCC45206]|uniref:hypothetical protein n=1 Tax=Rubrivirga sp. IMCC45206 TaxID=3391614 RepID=UPI00398FC973